jgi:preprotein translocase subunit SecG
MALLFLILLVLASVAIGFFILVQNPKGGGLAGNIAGFNSQFMGVKQTTDVLEKGTWLLAIVIALLCLFSVFFLPSGGNINAPGSGARPGTTQQQTPTNNPGGQQPPAQPR